MVCGPTCQSNLLQVVNKRFHSFIHTSHASLCISNLEIVYDCILSDHHPIIGVINCNIIVESTDDCCDQETQRIHWDKLHSNAFSAYKRQTENGFNSIQIPDGLKQDRPTVLDGGPH